ncbi:hypothetical protein [Pimelobacter simplex]|uniref:hypothetical protein n=1 Tax=Nocardioides simplex TaxID=2045 RepID=UPI00215063DB|nr:hypothetical protein [Pimelobacter simplex]UUW92473.1 hypothetical protein M0M43_13595 [Pimelobacter simplex]UUW96301.1 hypothetical protein M0M48_02230 [Pimelobacter simplex]
MQHMRDDLRRFDDESTTFTLTGVAERLSGKGRGGDRATQDVRTAKPRVAFPRMPVVPAPREHPAQGERQHAMLNSTPGPNENARPPFVPSEDDRTRGILTEQQRYVLWQATGVLIDDTFATAAGAAPDHMWFPPCTHQMRPQWWAKMRSAGDRIAEAFRTGKDLACQNFAEEVVVATVLGSEAIDQILDYVDDDPDEYASLSGGAEFDFTETLGDLADDMDAALLFPSSFEVDRDGSVVDAQWPVPVAVVAAVCGDPERWFDPYPLTLPGA